MKPKKTHAAGYSCCEGCHVWSLCSDQPIAKASKRPTCKRCQRILKAARAKGSKG